MNGGDDIESEYSSDSVMSDEDDDLKPKYFSCFSVLISRKQAQDIASDKKNDIKNGISYIHSKPLLLISVTTENRRARSVVPLVLKVQLAPTKVILPANAVKIFLNLEMVGQTLNGPFSNILTITFAVSAKKTQRISMR